MHDLPHHYLVSATAEERGNVTLSNSTLPPISSAPPAEFGGPGDQWSPETLLVAAVADCFILTFRAIARASKIEWHNLKCEVTGTLDKQDNITKFSHFLITAHLTIPQQTNEARASRLLEKSEKNCLITNSLTAKKELAIIIGRQN